MLPVNGKFDFPFSNKALIMNTKSDIEVMCSGNVTLNDQTNRNQTNRLPREN